MCPPTAPAPAKPGGESTTRVELGEDEGGAGLLMLTPVQWQTLRQALERSL